MNADTLRPAFVAMAQLARRNAGAGLPAKLVRKSIAAAAHAALEALPLAPTDRAELLEAYFEAYYADHVPAPAPSPTRTNPSATNEE